MKSPYRLALAGAFGLVAGASAMEIQHTQIASAPRRAYVIANIEDVPANSASSCGGRVRVYEPQKSPD
jgi:hypothetical protein